MNAVDTGWVTDMAPGGVGAVAATHATFVGPPLDAVDGAARVLDPIFSHVNAPEKWLVCAIAWATPHRRHLSLFAVPRTASRAGASLETHGRCAVDRVAALTDAASFGKTTLCPAGERKCMPLWLMHFLSRG